MDIRDWFDWLLQSTGAIMSRWFDAAIWERVGRDAPIAIALIALVAASIAYRALRVQRDLARKRAALDFFLKTETDKSMIEALHAYEDSMEKFANDRDPQVIYHDAAARRRVCAYLNVNELIAVGVDNKLLDEDLTFDFWSDELIGAYKDNIAFIEFMRTKDSAPFSYHALEKLYRRWLKRDEEDRRKLSKAG
jgi:hypothetical protein